MRITSPKQLDILREGGRRLAFILRALEAETKPGITTAELDARAESMIREAGGVPSFKGYHPDKSGNPFPASICISVNNEVVHGIPSHKRAVADSDVVKLDIGMWYGALCTDTAITVGVGKLSADAERLIAGTREALAAALETVQPGRRIGDVSFAIQHTLERHRLTPVRELSGHGVGKAVHEEPFVPNFGRAGTGPLLAEGMVLAFEPIASLGTWRIQLARDQWTWRTADGSLAAHFEHTLVVTANGAEVMTAA